MRHLALMLALWPALVWSVPAHSAAPDGPALAALRREVARLRPLGAGAPDVRRLRRALARLRREYAETPPGRRSLMEWETEALQRADDLDRLLRVRSPRSLAHGAGAFVRLYCDRNGRPAPESAVGSAPAGRSETAGPLPTGRGRDSANPPRAGRGSDTGNSPPAGQSDADSDLVFRERNGRLILPFGPGNLAKVSSHGAVRRAAERALRTALAAASGDPVLHKMLGDALGPAIGQASYQRALALDPRYFWAQVGLSDGRRVLGDEEGYLAGLRKAAGMAPDRLLPLYLQARVLMRRKRMEEALPVLERAVALDRCPTEPSLFWMAECYTSTQHWAQAVRVWERYLEAYPARPNGGYARVALARAHLGAGNFDGMTTAMRDAFQGDAETRGLMLFVIVCLVAPLALVGGVGANALRSRRRAQQAPATWRLSDVSLTFTAAVAANGLLTIAGAPFASVLLAQLATWVVLTFLIVGVKYREEPSALGLTGRNARRELMRGLKWAVPIIVAAGCIEWLANQGTLLVPAGTWLRDYLDRVRQEQLALKLIISDWGWRRGVGVLLVGVVGPIGVYIYFGGFLFGALRRRLPLPTAALLCGLFFGMAHLNVVNLVPLVFMGAALACLYQRGDSLVAPCVVHVLNNTAACLITIYGTR